ncbi:MAG: protein kinase domain-containing protein [Planctomycetota bacterium]
MVSTSEPFELLELLGVGGFAHTYRARVLDPVLAEDFGAEEVALKIPLSRQKERVLKHELELNAGLYLRIKGMGPSNVVRYLGFAVFRNQIVMAMEYVSEGSLRGLMGSVERPKRLPVDEAVQIAQGVLNGLTVIHKEHFFHRDIKPENILMASGTPKIADLGLARILDANELVSSNRCTLPYASPELLSEEGASFPADIWSVGVMLYEMVTGKLPFGTFATPIEPMVRLICSGEHTPACEVQEEVPRPLSDIIDRALNVQPTGRFAGPADMHSALSDLGKELQDEVEQEFVALRQMAPADRGRTAEARLKELMAGHPNDPRLYQHLGEHYNLCQRYHQAVAVFQHGLKLDPDNVLLHWDLALAYQRIGRRAKAADHLRKVVDSAPDASLRRHAKTLLKALGGGEV